MSLTTSCSKLLILSALGLTLGAGAAGAQERSGFQLNRYEPTPAGEWSFMVPHPWYSSTRFLAAGVTLNYAHNPLLYGLRGPADSQFAERGVVIEHSAIMHFDLAMSFFDRVTAAITLPVTMVERGNQIEGVGVGPISGGALGDPRLGGMVRLWRHPDRDPISLSAGLDIWVPIGAEDKHQGDRGARVLPKVVLAGLSNHIRWSGTLGFYYRPDATIGALPETIGSTLGPSLQLGLSAYYADLDRRFAVGPELLMHTTVTNGNAFQKDFTSLELLFGAHYNIARVVQTGLALGLGTLRDPGTPDFRLLFRLAYAPLGERKRPLPPPRPAPAPLPPPLPYPVAPPPPPPPPPAPDPCKEAKVLIKEDRFDVREQILFRKDSSEIQPASDALLREIAAAIKGRPAVRRVSVEGHTDSDGSDGYNQVLSEGRARSVRLWLIQRGGIDPQRLESHGFGEKRPKVTPEVTDADKEQNRRVEFRIIDPDPRVSPQREGCVCKVTISDDKLSINDEILFETGKADLKGESFGILEAVASTIKSHPEIRRISIEGHTDTDGSDEMNQRLSEDRAASVRRWLVEQGGVDEAILSSKGWGESRLKVRPERTKADKAQNRRVEFMILERSTSSSQDPCAAEPQQQQQQQQN